MKRLDHCGVGALVVSVALSAGCGGQAPPAPAKFETSEVGANQRLKKPSQDYKQMLGPNGQMNWKPGMKQPTPSAKP